VLEDYQDDKSVVFVKIHHCLSDAMGLMQIFSFLGNEAKSMKGKDIGFFENFKYYILMPWYFLKGVRGCFMVFPSKIEHPLKPKPSSHNKKFLSSKVYQFNSF
jgi:hypothetical protein